MRGIKGTAKREEAVNVFKEGEVSRCRVNVIIGGVQKMERARERVAILLNDVRHNSWRYFECVSSRIFWIKFKFSRV